MILHVFFPIPRVWDLLSCCHCLLKLKDSLSRLWQCSTLQLDFNTPKRFNLNFTNLKGKRERVIMIHRAIFGSIERFIGILIEHYNGELPLWITPEQVRITTITGKNIKL